MSIPPLEEVGLEHPGYFDPDLHLSAPSDDENFLAPASGSESEGEPVVSSWSFAGFRSLVGRVTHSVCNKAYAVKDSLVQKVSESEFIQHAWRELSAQPMELSSDDDVSESDSEFEGEPVTSEDELPSWAPKTPLTRFIGKSYKIGCSVAGKVVTKALECETGRNVAERLAHSLFLGNQDRRGGELDRWKTKLETMQSTGRLVEFLETLRNSAFLYAKIWGVIEEEHELIKNFSPEIKEEIYESVWVLIYKAVGNLTETAIRKFQQEQPGVEFNAVAVLVESVLGMVFTELSQDKIDQEKFLKAQKLSKSLKEAKNAKYFGPAAQTLLKQAFPEGADELKMKLQGPVLGMVQKMLPDLWGMVQKTLPDVLAALYQFIHCPGHETSIDTKMLNRKGGVPLRSIIGSSARLIRRITPEAIGDGRVKLTEMIFKKTNKKVKPLEEAPAAEVVEPALDIELPPPAADEEALGVDQAEAEEAGPPQDPQRQVKDWLAGTLEVLVGLDTPTTQKLWNIVEVQATSLLSHALAKAVATAHADQAPETNVIPGTLKHLLGIITTFLREKQEDIDAQIARMDAHPAETHPVEHRAASKQLMRHFRQLTRTLLTAVDLWDDPLIGLVKNQVIPSFCLDSYRDMLRNQESIPQFLVRLQRKLYDQEAFFNVPAPQRERNEVVIAAAAPENREQVTFNLAGVKQHADDFLESCNAMGADLRTVTERYLRNPANILTIVKLLRKDLSPEQQIVLAEGIKTFVDDAENPDITGIFDYSQTLIQATTFKLFVAIVENTPGGPHVPLGGNRNANLAANVTHKLFSLLGEEVETIQPAIARIKATRETEEEKEEKINQLFRPLTSKLLRLAGEDWKLLLPISNDLRNPLAEVLEEELLPSLLHLIYTEMYGWVGEIQTMEEEIDRTFGSTASKLAVSQFTDYIEAYIPTLLEENPEKVARLLEHVGGKYIQHLDDGQRREVHRMVVRNIHLIGKDESNGTVWKACAVYAKAMMLKMVLGISSEISLNERVKGLRGESTFLLETVVKGMEIAKNHFVDLSNIPMRGRVSPAHTVKHSEILVGFKKNDILHPALDRDAAGSTEARVARRLECFYKPLAKDLIELAHIDDPNLFPMPSGIRVEMFKLFQEDLLPEVLMNIFNEMLEPRNLNKSFLMLIDRLNITIEELEHDHYIEYDEHQRELNEACGEIIKSMVNLVPAIFTKTFFPADRIKEMTSEYVGGLVRRRLKKTNMLELMNMLLTSSNMVDPRKKEAKDYRAQVRDDRTVQRELIKKLTAYISQQVKETVQENIHRKWTGFQTSFDAAIQKFAGKPALVVKQFFDFLFGIVVFKMLMPLFNVLFYKMFWFFIDLMIVRKSIEIIHDSHMKIHENLVFNLTDKFIHLMKLAKLSRAEALVEEAPAAPPAEARTEPPVRRVRRPRVPRPLTRAEGASPLVAALDLPESPTKRITRPRSGSR